MKKGFDLRIKFRFVPGTTDYMDRFIDEQDPSKDLSSNPPNYHSLLYGSDARKTPGRNLLTNLTLKE